MRVLILLGRVNTKIKINTIMFLICMTLLNTQPCFAITQKQVEQNVLPLTEASAVLNICFESVSYDSLSDDLAHKLRGLDFRIDDLVQMLADYYNEESLLLSHGMISMEMSSDPELIAQVREEYQYCGSKLFVDMENYVSAAERKIRGLASSKTKK